MKKWYEEKTKAEKIGNPEKVLEFTVGARNTRRNSKNVGIPKNLSFFPLVLEFQPFWLSWYIYIYNNNILGI